MFRLCLKSIESQFILQSLCFSNTFASKRTMRFCVNINTVFQDIPNHINKYEEVLKRKDFTFDAIEDGNPYERSLEEWTQFLAKVPTLKWVLINSLPLWDHYSHNTPDCQQFQLFLQQTADYVKTLNVSKVHLLLKDIKNDSEIPKMRELISFGARYLQPLGVMCVIEPLSIRPNYYLRSYDLAKQLVQEINQPNVKLMLDTYHLQKLHGNITQYIEALKPYIGHIQVSQVPLRDCPINEGEINHNYVLKQISQVYDDYVGLEYINKSDDSFEWLNKFKKL
ncbi:putative hydroxypyruvate isomerase [Oppia nitens]|uniref:putative hydroxypyruvate isomerase n=1 Tax=Oppia nitens TaxID=1686743 RepID=UPI0023DA4AF0|nr:putative hydroxypyruvate isomerase [Oppia nitens]